jgi:RNA polymerase sigma-70 factor (ECF subfamily)
MTSPDDFETFMRSYQNMVFSTAVRLLGNETDAADVSQEVFIKAYERFGDLAPNPRAGGWLKTVTTNLCLNHLTRYRARWRFFSEMAGDEPGDDFSARLAAPEEQDGRHDEEHQRRVVEDALQKLPDAHRVPLVLYHFEEMSYEEIARQLGVSLSKVKTDIHRGREALRKRLRLRLDDEPASSASGGAASARPALAPGGV